MHDHEAEATPQISVVVPTHRRLDSLQRLMAGLGEQTLPRDRWGTVIVDDGSGPDIAESIDELVREAPFSVKVIHRESSGGPAVARNSGWRTTDTPLVAFVDDDCVPQPKWLECGVGGFTGPGVGVVQGRTVRPTTGDPYPYTPFTVVREVSAPSPWFEGCNIFFRRDALERAGGFDESFGRFPCGEDTNLGWSVLGAGWERGWAEDAVVEHELSERTWSWHLRFHWLEGNSVELAARHPDMRAMFWRPWAIKRENALFAAAVAGTVASLRFKPAILATLPYVAWLGPGRRTGIAGVILQVASHGASLGGKLAAGVRTRTFLL